jgi:hypothetical protein
VSGSSGTTGVLDCPGAGAGVVTRTLVRELTEQGPYRAVQVSADRIVFARTYRPTWALVLGILLLPVALIGIFFLLYRVTETCTALIESDFRGTRVRLTGPVDPEVLVDLRALLATAGASAPPKVAAPTDHVDGQVSAGLIESASAPGSIELSSDPVPHPSSKHLPSVYVPSANDEAPPSDGPVGMVSPWVPPSLDLEPETPSQPAPVPRSAEDDRTVVVDRDQMPAVRGALIIELDNGRTVDLRGRLNIGRQPSALDGDAVDLVTVDGDARSVSKTHLGLVVDDRGLRVADLHSTNGSRVVDPTGVSFELRPGEWTLIAAGTTVQFGERSLRVLGGGQQ